MIDKSSLLAKTLPKNQMVLFPCGNRLKKLCHARQSHRILMSKCYLQGKSPAPNAACGRNFSSALPEG